MRVLAASAGLKVHEISKTGTQVSAISVTVLVPDNSSTPAPEVAKAFFMDVVKVLSASSDVDEHAHLINISETDDPEFFSYHETQFKLLLVAGIALAAWAMGSWLHEDRKLSVFTSVLGGAAVFPVGIGLMILWKKMHELDFAIRMENRREKTVHADTLVQQAAKGEDPAMRARLELARIALRTRAGAMRGDADRLWSRSVWAYRGALCFFTLALVGPTVAVALLLSSATPDWHFMFAGLSLAAVPLGIGTALLRHDTKLRGQYQEAARDVVLLERYELALDYGRITSMKTYQATVQSVITQLLSARPGSQAIHAAIPMRDEEQVGEDDTGMDFKKITGAVTRKAVELVEKAGESSASVSPDRKGGRS